MLFYITLFLIFFYFKLARVHKKEEKITKFTYLIHFIVAISALFLYVCGIKQQSVLLIAAFSFLFFIINALIITAVQVGVFIDGKPFIGMGRLYSFMPYLAFLIALLTIFNCFI